MRSNATVVLVAAALILAVAPWAAAQTQQTDLSGTWDMQATVQLPTGEPTAEALSKGVEIAPDCEYEGTAQIVDQDGDLSGTVDLMLVTGPDACPAEMSGALQGTADPGTSDISLVGSISGPLGMLDFSGSVTPNPGGGGSFSVTQGSFTGAQGTWAAQMLQSVLEIPTLTVMGLTLLTLLVLGAGYFILRQAAG